MNRIAGGSRIAALVLAAGMACNAGAHVSPKADPWVVGWVTDSLTSGSSLNKVPWWALYIVVVGADANHSGISSQGALGRLDVDPKTAGQRCLGVAGQFPGERQLVYVALGDSLYSADSLAFWTLVNRLGQGADSLRAVLDSALTGRFAARLPGLVVLNTGLFDPTVSLYGRGSSPQDAIVRHWSWTDRGVSFFEDSTQAARRCLN